MARKLIYIPDEFSLNPELAVEGFTQSEMSMMSNCAQRWNFRYNLMLEKKGEFNWAAAYGSWMHAALEEWYTTKGKRWTWNPTFRKPPMFTGIMRQEQEYWEALGKMQMQVYTSYYKNDHKIFSFREGGVEEIVDIDFKQDGWTFRLKGMIDLLLYHEGRKGYFTMDHKTSSRLDRATIMGWDFRFQFMFYCWLAKRRWPKLKIKGWIPNGIKKSQLKFNPDKEGLEEHIGRVREDMLAYPEKYFYREPLPFTKDAIDHFEIATLRPKLLKLKMLMDPKVPMDQKVAIANDRNTDYCVKYGAKYACPYLALCEKGPEIEGFRYVRREHKHEELLDEEE